MKPGPIYWLSIGVVVFAMAASPGCGDDEETIAPGAGGGGATTAPASTGASPVTSSSGTGGASDCFGPPNGMCEIESLEDCECADCEGTAMCNPGACVDDDFCDDLDDSCSCPDCDTDYFCADPADLNCENDGFCDWVEGCNCADCFSDSNCTDNVAACEGMAPDGTCNLGAESCLCPDCMGTAGCAMCVDDASCTTTEACFCTDCVSDAFCLDPANCFDDGICAPLYEGCGCTDCAGIPECGGGGAGGGGGS